MHKVRHIVKEAFHNFLSLAFVILIKSQAAFPMTFIKLIRSLFCLSQIIYRRRRKSGKVENKIISDKIVKKKLIETKWENVDNKIKLNKESKIKEEKKAKKYKGRVKKKKKKRKNVERKKKK